MSIVSRIIGGVKKNELFIGNDGEVRIRDLGTLASSSRDLAVPFDLLFSEANGNTSMLVDGSTNAVDFEINPAESGDRLVKTLLFTIEANNAKLSDFGNTSALAVGIDVIYITSTSGETIINSDGGLKSNAEIAKFCTIMPAIGTGIDVLKLKSFGGGNSDAYVFSLDVQVVYGISQGLRLRQGTNQRVVIRIKDDLVGASTAFTVKASGQDLLE